MGEDRSFLLVLVKHFARCQTSLLLFLTYISHSLIGGHSDLRDTAYPARLLLWVDYGLPRNTIPLLLRNGETEARHDSPYL